MSTTPAAHLARLKVAYPTWSIHAIEPGKDTGYTAQRQAGQGGLQHLYAPTVPELETALRQAANGKD
jgi:hypothetical protein